jgi:hypothetical protein
LPWRAAAAGRPYLKSSIMLFYLRKMIKGRKKEYRCNASLKRGTTGRGGFSLPIRRATCLRRSGFAQAG